MNYISRILNRYDRRILLVSAALLLLLLNFGRWIKSSYDSRHAELESLQSRLNQYQMMTGRTESLEKKLARLKVRKDEMSKVFFSGEDEDKIASAMQINLQALVGLSGLETESLRPIRQKSEKDDSGPEISIGEVAVKARLLGTLEEFVDFIAELYRSEKFFRVESFTLRPYKKSGLKIFIEFRGYFVLEKLPEENAKESPATASTTET